MFSLWAFSVSVSRKFTWIHWITLCWQPTKMYQMSWLWQFSYCKCTRFIVRCMESQYTKTLVAKRFNPKAAKWGDGRKPQIHLSEEFEDRDFMGFGWVVGWGVGIIYCWKSTGWNHRVRRWRNWLNSSVRVSCWYQLFRWNLGSEKHLKQYFNKSLMIITSEVLSIETMGMQRFST